MSVKAILKIDGKEYNLLNAEYNFRRYTAQAGYATNTMRFEKIKLELVAEANTFFLQWMFKPELQKSGSISFYENEERIVKIKQVVFAGAFCMDYKEKFNAFNKEPFIIYLGLSAGGVKISEAIFRFPWFNGPLVAPNDFLQEIKIEELKTLPIPTPVKTVTVGPPVVLTPLATAPIVPIAPVVPFNTPLAAIPIMPEMPIPTKLQIHSPIAAVPINSALPGLVTMPVKDSHLIETKTPLNSENLNSKNNTSKVNEQTASSGDYEDFYGNPEIIIGNTGLVANLVDTNSKTNYPKNIEEVGKGIKLIIKNPIKILGKFSINTSKFDYFFGNLATKSKPVGELSKRELENLAKSELRGELFKKMGMEDTLVGKSKLIEFANNAFDNGIVVTKPFINEWGTTVTKQVTEEIDGQKYTFNVSFITRIGETVPELSTISVPQLNKLIPEKIKQIKNGSN